MTLYLVKLGLVFTFMKYFAGVASLIFLEKTLIWNKIKFSGSNLLNHTEIVVNESIRSICKKCTNIPFSIQFITV